MATTLDGKIARYIDDLFRDVGPSRELLDLKEELAANLRDKVADLQARGIDEEQAFREAVISMGDLSGLVDDMRRLGREQAREAVYITKNNRLSALGIVAGVLLMLFGLFNVLMLYTMGGVPGQAVAGNGIFAVAGGALLTYSLLIRETRRRYGMNPIRAALYALAVGLVLFGIFVGVTSRFATGQLYIGIAATMVFFMAGTGLFLYLVLTERDRSKA